jgi:hypothetical protein
MKTFLALTAAIAVSAFAHEVPSKSGQTHPASADMIKAANALLEKLPAEQKAKAVFEFGNAERKNWHFVPRERKGLPLKEMSPEVRKLAMELAKTGLSNDGYKKATLIMSLEPILREMEKDTTGRRDPDKYFVSIFGTPGTKEPWGWRFEGHHLSLNYSTVSGAAPSMTPSFFGSNPGEIREGENKGLRILGKEEDLGRELIQSLTDEQRKIAIIAGQAPSDILSLPSRPERTKPEGIAWDKLTPAQQTKLKLVIKEQLFRCRSDVAEEEIVRIEKAGLSKIHFAWAGGLERGEPHYYRVQNESFVVEYDNTQGKANHPHSVWRDWDNDFGGDILKQHHEESHGKK